MLLSTTHIIEGKKIVKQLGLVTGNTIRARHIGRDIMAGLRESPGVLGVSSDEPHIQNPGKI